MFSLGQGTPDTVKNDLAAQADFVHLKAVSVPWFIGKSDGASAILVRTIWPSHTWYRPDVQPTLSPV